MQSMWTGLSGLNASQNLLQTISGNISNQSTNGYAESDESFSDMLTTHLTNNATAPEIAGKYTNDGLWQGTGVFTVQQENNFSGMSEKQTGRSLDFALNGNNFFAIDSGNGQTAYTKAGDFKLSANADGTANLVNNDGQNVLGANSQPIVVPKGTSKIAVGQDGTLSFDGTPSSQKIAIAQIGTPSQFLVASGNNNYTLGQGGQVSVVNKGTTTPPNVQLMQGYLTGNNVDLTDQMSKMVQAQNLYDLNAKTVEISNQMMQTANKIKP